jgi:uncharacterized RDD family membrane protein YckC
MNFASIGKRFLAMLIDGIILFFANKFIHFLPLIGKVPLVMFVAFIVYSAWLESSKYRATVGKIVMGIEVADLSGNAIPLKTAVLRAVGKLISALIMMIGFIFAFFTENKQALHDIIARTLVLDSVKSPAKSE